jgi:hypothetical protein
MAALTGYSADSSALIHGWRRIYRPKNFGFVWDRLGTLIEEGRLKASIEVYNDLEKKDDELFKWCKERKDKLVVDIDDNIQAHVARIMKVHPRLVDTVGIIRLTYHDASCRMPSELRGTRYDHGKS